LLGAIERTQGLNSGIRLFIYYFALLGFELQASCLLGRYSLL
jgi:hypothetical protein